MLAVVEAEIPPIASVREGLAEDWTSFFERILARDRAARFGSAADVQEALERILEREGPVTKEDLRELLATEDGLEELDLDDTSEEVPREVEPVLVDDPSPRVLEGAEAVSVETIVAEAAAPETAVESADVPELAKGLETTR